MLIGLDLLLGPDLLYALRAMGHGDDIVLADANFPAQSVGSRVIRAEGCDLPCLLVAVLKVLPIDQMEPDPAVGMEVVAIGRGESRSTPISNACWPSTPSRRQG